jgi:hypothetical protein
MYDSDDVRSMRSLLLRIALCRLAHQKVSYVSQSLECCKVYEFGICPVTSHVCSDNDVDQYFSKPLASGKQVSLLALYFQVFPVSVYLTMLSLARRRIMLKTNYLQRIRKEWVVVYLKILS